MEQGPFLSRLDFILTALAALVAAHLARHPTLVLQLRPLWAYLRHVTLRVQRALVRPPRSPSPAASQPAEPRPSRKRPRPAWRLPTSPVWMIRLLGYQAAGYASQLRCLLAEPETQALLAASPAALRHLKPLIRILIPPHWDNPFACAQRPDPRPGLPQPGIPPVLPASPEKLA